MVSKYRVGYALERDIKNRLKRMNYYVIRSAKSETLCDLIAIPLKEGFEKDVLCIQCKNSTVPNKLPHITQKELSKLSKLEEHYKVKVMLAIRFRFKGRWHTLLVTPAEYRKLKNTIKMS